MGDRWPSATASSRIREPGGQARWSTRRIATLASRDPSVATITRIGGGLIGCEVASDLQKAGDAVTIFHREGRLLELVFDEHQSRALHEHFESRGVDLRYNQDLRELFPRGVFDGVIVAAGFAPRVELARDAGLAATRGIVVVVAAIVMGVYPKPILERSEKSVQAFVDNYRDRLQEARRAPEAPAHVYPALPGAPAAAPPPSPPPAPGARP